MKTLLDEAGKDFLEKTEEVVFLESEVQKAQVTRNSNIISVVGRYVLGENKIPLLTVAKLVVVQRIILTALAFIFLWLTVIVLIIKWVCMKPECKNKIKIKDKLTH